jgi:hypothetical protein
MIPTQMAFWSRTGFDCSFPRIVEPLAQFLRAQHPGEHVDIPRYVTRLGEAAYAADCDRLAKGGCRTIGGR